MSSVSVEDCAQVIIQYFGIGSVADRGLVEVRNWIRSWPGGEYVGDDYKYYIPSKQDSLVVRDFQVAKLLVRLLKRAGLSVRCKLEPNGLSRILLFTPRDSYPEGVPKEAVSTVDRAYWAHVLASIVCGATWANDLGGELFSLSAAFARIERTKLHNGAAISRKLRSLAKELKAVSDFPV